MNISLRNYQSEAVSKTIEFFDQGITRQLLTLPTGNKKIIL